MCVIQSRPGGPCFKSGNISNHAYRWREIGASDTVLSWIQDGVPLPLDEEPVPFEFRNKNFSWVQARWIDKEVNNLLDHGAIVEVKEKPQFISPISVAPKKDGDFRLIVDLRQLNGYCKPPRFAYEDIEEVLKQVKPKDHLVTIDIKKCFYHVPIANHYQQFINIQWRNRYYQWCVLPFGLNCSPYFVNKVLRPIVAYLRTQGIRVVCYVDDIILMSSKDTVVEQRDRTLVLLASLGLFVNWEKSSLEPCTEKEFIGYNVSTDNDDSCVWVRIPRSRISKVVKDIKRVLGKGRINARGLARIAGQCVSMAKAVLPAKLLLRNVYRLLSTRSSWQDSLILDEPTVSDLKWWVASLKSWNGRAVKPVQIDFQLTTDASSLGWGAKLQELQAQGVWNTRLAYKHSNYRELMAILLALHSFLPHLRHRVVQVLTDNITAAAYLNFQGGPSVELTQVATAIWELIVENNIVISARYLAGRLNTEADYLSRLVSHTEWKLNPKLFSYLDRLWGPHTVDRFASMCTTQLMRYNSQYLDPCTEAVDALAQVDWREENNYVNPPFRLLNRVLDVVQMQEASATVIAPVWPAQSWFRRLVTMSVQPPIPVPNRENAILQIGPKIPEPLRNRLWRLYAWRICGTKN